MAAIRVIQWTTGKVGRHSLKAIIEDPRFEVVGLYAYSAEKVGQDAGEMVGLPASGVLATDDVDTLVSELADVVIYTPFEADIDHLMEGGVFARDRWFDLVQRTLVVRDVVVSARLGGAHQDGGGDDVEELPPHDDQRDGEGEAEVILNPVAAEHQVA